jgi:hypothetical protein
MLQRSIRRHQAADSLLQRRHAIAACLVQWYRGDMTSVAMLSGADSMAWRRDSISAGTDRGDVTGVAMLCGADSMALRAIPFPRGLIHHAVMSAFHSCD